MMVMYLILILKKNIPCFRCFMPDLPSIENKCGSEGLFPTLAGVAGTIQANEVIKSILGIKNSLTGKMVVFNVINMKFRIVKLTKSKLFDLLQKKMKLIQITFFLIIYILFSQITFADEYFLTLRNDTANLRQGPSFDYPIKIFYKKYLPVLIQDRSDNFRKIKDHENNTGWLHISQLSKKSSFASAGKCYIV